MKITCTKAEMEELSEMLVHAESCFFIRTDPACTVVDEYCVSDISCEECVKSRIEWDILPDGSDT